MIFLKSPAPDAIRRFLDEQSRLEFTYAAVGASRESVALGYVVDHTRVLLGTGRTVFETAVAGLRQWRQFALGWVTAGPADTPIEVGRCIAVWARAVGVCWVNACRIVYVIDEDGPLCRFGFAYGTLPGHVESGEERFLIEWDRRDDRVWYDILAFSRPWHWTAKIGYPLVRRRQRQFARGSASAMQDAVK